jgi:anti-sigma factor RsiW
MQACKEVLSLLSDYLDLELPPDACHAVEAHLSTCSPCEEFAESLRKTVELCRQYQPGELPRPISESARTELLAAYQRSRQARP